MTNETLHTLMKICHPEALEALLEWAQAHLAVTPLEYHQIRSATHIIMPGTDLDRKCQRMFEADHRLWDMRILTTVVDEYKGHIINKLYQRKMQRKMPPITNQNVEDWYNDNLVKNSAEF